MSWAFEKVEPSPASATKRQRQWSTVKVSEKPSGYTLTPRLPIDWSLEAVAVDGFEQCAEFVDDAVVRAFLPIQEYDSVAYQERVCSNYSKFNSMTASIIIFFS